MQFDITAFRHPLLFGIPLAYIARWLQDLKLHVWSALNTIQLCYALIVAARTNVQRGRWRWIWWHLGGCGTFCTTRDFVEEETCLTLRNHRRFWQTKFMQNYVRFKARVARMCAAEKLPANTFWTMGSWRNSFQCWTLPWVSIVGRRNQVPQPKIKLKEDENGRQRKVNTEQNTTREAAGWKPSSAEWERPCLAWKGSLDPLRGASVSWQGWEKTSRATGQSMPPRAWQTYHCCCCCC